MADPRRYDIYAVLKTGDGEPEAGLTYTDAKFGEWVKWHDFEDYKAGQRRNRAEATAVKLGLEVVHLRTRIEDLENEIKELRERISK